MRSYTANGWKEYNFRHDNPFGELEDRAREIEVIDEALNALVEAKILPHTLYRKDKMLVHRAAVRANFEIPWSGITPRMERLIFAVNSIVRPKVMVAMGIFCGYTFISNAGTAIGPGAHYKAEKLVGVEIRPDEAGRAQRNVAKLDAAGEATIVAADGIEWLRTFDETIDLLYIDADESYYPIIQAAALRSLHPGSLVLAHNSVNFKNFGGKAAKDVEDYLGYVRQPDNSSESINMFIDAEGLEVSLWLKRPPE